MQNIDKVPVYDQYKSDSILYAMEVNRRRSIPDYRDGLKQVHRRIIDVMYSVEKCINHTVKSSAIVGSVMKKSHPHGDTAIYQSMKPMANWFECNIPFIISQGGFGSFQGDGMSAWRKYDPGGKSCGKNQNRMFSEDREKSGWQFRSSADSGTPA